MFIGLIDISCARYVNIYNYACVVVLWFWGWGNEHHNAWRRQLSRDLARASSWEAGCHGCCVAGTRGVRSSLSVVSRVIRRRNTDKGLRWSRVGEDVLSSCLWALSARCESLPGRVVSGCCVASVSVVTGDDICVKVSTSCCECSVSVQDGNTFASVELLMPLHPATFGTRSNLNFVVVIATKWRLCVAAIFDWAGISLLVSYRVLLVLVSCLQSGSGRYFCQ